MAQTVENHSLRNANQLELFIDMVLLTFPVFVNSIQHIHTHPHILTHTHIHKNTHSYTHLSTLELALSRDKYSIDKQTDNRQKISAKLEAEW